MHVESICSGMCVNKVVEIKCRRLNSLNCIAGQCIGAVQHQLQVCGFIRTVVVVITLQGVACIIISKTVISMCCRGKKLARPDLGCRLRLKVFRRPMSFACKRHIITASSSMCTFCCIDIVDVIPIYKRRL